LGIAYFRFDHRGCGRSEGGFKEVTRLAYRRQDLIDAVMYLRTEFYLGSAVGLFGSSFGGATCLAAAPLVKPNRMVTLAAPVDSRSILAATKAKPPVEPPFLDAAFQFDLSNAIRSISNLLVIHGADDATIPISHARQIYNGLSEPKKLLIIPGGDHRLSQKDHQQCFMDATLNWFRPLMPSTD
jgi:alpha-beta hydrolase superfamily lysophospholipase